MFTANQFKLLTFTGVASGAALTPQFDHEILQGKYLVIKRIKIDYYLEFVADPGPQVARDVAFANDAVSFVAGANTRYLLKPSGTIIDITDLDRYVESGLLNKEFLKLKINGSALDLFPHNNNNVSGVIDMDNLNIYIPEKINNEEIEWRYTKGLTYPDNSGSFFPRVVISMETYLLGQLSEIRQFEPATFKRAHESK